MIPVLRAGAAGQCKAGVRLIMVAGCILLTTLVGCDYPRDPMGTLERVRDGKVRVGVVVNGPWTTMDGAPSGVEVELVESFAGRLEARTVYVRGTTPELLEATKQGEVDVLIGGVTDESPGIREQKEAGITRPYLITRPVVGVAPGRHLDDLDGIRVAVAEIDATAAHLKEEGAVPVRVAALRGSDLPVAAYRWQVEAWGLDPAAVELPEERHVMAVPPGENGWLVELERFLGGHGDRARQLLETRA